MKVCASSQRGIALVTALLVVAVAAIAASAMLVTHNIAVHRSSNLRYIEQAWWYGAGVENWIGEILRKDKEQDGQEGTDHLGEDWAQAVAGLPIEGGSISGRIIDQQSCFNINNLVGHHADQAAAQFKRLLGLLEDSDPYMAPGLIQSIQDWIDDNQAPRPPGGAEDGIYTGMDPPYRAANQLMQSTTELLLVNGMTAELYQALEPYICVLPSSKTQINVNTAEHPEILASLAEGLTREDGKTLIEERDKKGHWDTVTDFQAEERMFGRTVEPAMLSVDTSYFLLSGQIEVGNGRVRLYSLIHRKSDGTPLLLAHSKDVY